MSRNEEDVIRGFADVEFEQPSPFADVEFEQVQAAPTQGFADIDFAGENTQDELDKGPPSFFEIMATANNMSYLLEPNMEPARLTKREFLNKATQDLRAAKDVAQDTITGVLGHSPTAGDGRLERSVESAFDVAAQIPSSVLEQIGELGGAVTGLAREDNPVIDIARVLREGTQIQEFEDRDTFDDIIQGILQTGAFAVGGKTTSTALGLGNKFAGVVAAWLGAAVGGQAGKEDAARYGASEEQMDVAYWANSLFGTSEGLSIGLALGRIDDMTGGILSRKLKSKTAQVLASGTQSAIEEGLQEAFQTAGENWVASDIAAYDPGRSLGENIGEAATIGGSVGMLLGLVTGALGVRNRARIQEEVDAVLEGTGANSLDEIAGPMTTLDDQYWSLLKDIGTIQQRLRETSKGFGTDEEVAFEMQVDEAIETGSDLFQQREDRLLEKVSPRVLEARQITGAIEQFEGKPISSEAFWATPVNTAAENGDFSILTAGSPVTAALSQKQEEARVILPEMENNIDRLKNMLEQEMSAEEKAQVQQTLDEWTLKRDTLKHLVKVEATVAKEVKNLLAKWRTLLPEKSKLLAVNTDNLLTSTVKGEAGIIVRPDGEKMNTLFLNTRDLFAAEAAAFTKPESSLVQEIRDRERTAFLSTLLHEFGHLHSFNVFSELQNKVNSETATQLEKDQWGALVADYSRFVTENLNSPSALALSRMMSLPRFRRWMEHWLQKDSVAGTAPLNDRDFFRVANNFYNKQSLPEQAAKSTVNYLFSMEEYMAEEFSKAQLNIKNPLLDDLKFFAKGLRDMKKAMAQMPSKFRSTSGSMNDFFRLHSLRGQVAEAAKRSTEAIKHPLVAAAEIEGVDATLAKRIVREQDVFNAFMDVGFNILQIAQLNPHIRGLQDYVVTMRGWKNEVNNTLAVAEDRLVEWKDLGKKESETLGRLLLDETLGRKPDGGWLSEPRNFTDEEVAAYDLSPEALALRQKVKEDFRSSLGRMERVLIAAKMRIFEGDTTRQIQEVAEVQKEFRRMRSRPYFPLMRFGEYTLQVRAKADITFEGKRYKEDDIIEFQAFDTKQERDRALSKLRRAMGAAFKYSGSKMVQPNFSVQGMPLTLIDHLENRLETVELTKEQREIIQEVKKDVLPFRSFRKQFQRRKKVLGFSFDAQRAYANYMSSFANHIARVEFDQQFKENLDSVRDSISAINLKDGGDSTKRAEILNHMNNHLQYVMNPVNEFVGLRSAAFFWFLGFNVKSAFVNLTQIPLVTYPYLAARFGDGRAVAQLTRAYKQAPLIFQKASEVTNKELSGLIQQGISESWLDESLATELALAASEKNLDKSLPRKARQKAAQKLSHWGSLPFHKAEKLNRFVTAIATFRLAKADGASEASAIEEARRAVEKTQFEYARWARPRFQRGKLGGTVFVFLNYMQNALFFALGGDPGALRMITMLFLLAGLQGLPFGEDIMDLVDASMSVLKKKAGVKDPHTAVRVDLRKMLKDLEIDPDLVLHGLSSSSFGLSQLGEFMGWPIPDLDLSGSLSMGRIIPGAGLAQPGREATFERFLADASERAGGAVVSGMSGIARAFFDSHPDQWKRWERAMPAAMRQISKAARFKARGEEATRAGYPIAGFDMTDARDQAEIIGQSLGFTPREVSKGWEAFIAKQQAITYYESWKSSLLRQWNYAHENRDQEEVKRTNAEIRKYNRAVPFPEMKIGPETRQRSYNSYLSTRQFNSRRIEQSRRDRRLSSSIQRVFEEAEDN